MKRVETLKLVIAGLLTALGVVLPTLVHTLIPVPNIGMIALPMHIPVLLCGFLCGWKLGLISGILVPFLASFITGMPPIYPVAISMAFELAAYGAVSGLLNKTKLPKPVDLVLAMIAGRVVMALANIVLLGIKGNSYGIQAFISGAFVTAWPGILAQLILVPVILLAVSKNRVLSDAKNQSE